MVQRPSDTPDLIRDGYEPAVDEFSLSQRPLVGAIVALDPHTGRLLAMSGGYNFADSEFNRAVQACASLVRPLNPSSIWRRSITAIRRQRVFWMRRWLWIRVG